MIIDSQPELRQRQWLSAASKEHDWALDIANRAEIPQAPDAVPFWYVQPTYKIADVVEYADPEAMFNDLVAYCGPLAVVQAGMQLEPELINDPYDFLTGEVASHSLRSAYNELRIKELPDTTGFTVAFGDQSDYSHDLGSAARLQYLPGEPTHVKGHDTFTLEYSGDLALTANGLLAVSFIAAKSWYAPPTKEYALLAAKTELRLSSIVKHLAKLTGLSMDAQSELTAKALYRLNDCCPTRSDVSSIVRDDRANCSVDFSGRLPFHTRQGHQTYPPQLGPEGEVIGYSWFGDLRSNHDLGYLNHLMTTGVPYTSADGCVALPDIRFNVNASFTQTALRNRLAALSIIAGYQAKNCHDQNFRGLFDFRGYGRYVHIPGDELVDIMDAP